MTKAEAAFSELRRRIIVGELAPGSPIQQEELAAELDVSTTPLREALRALEAERLIVDVAHHGAQVAPLSLDVVLETYAIRMELDPMAARLATVRATESDMTLAADALQRPASNRFERMANSRAFHRAIYASSGNSELTHILDSLWDRSDRYRYTLVETEGERAQETSKDHEDMLMAFMTRDPARLEALLVAHLEASVRRLRAIHDG